MMAAYLLSIMTALRDVHIEDCCHLVSVKSIGKVSKSDKIPLKFCWTLGRIESMHSTIIYI